MRKGQKMPVETKEKLSKIRKGRTPWNKGISRTEEEKLKISNSLKGRTLSEEVKSNMREAQKIVHSVEGYSERHSKLMTEIFKNPELRKRRSEIGKRNWGNKEYAEKVSKAQGRKPTKPEILLDSILNTIFPNEWKYVGNGKFFIEGKNPDFMNIDGKKLLIELFGDYWHRNQNPQDRIDVFKPYGFDTLVIWEKELKDMNNTINKIKDFVERRY